MDAKVVYCDRCARGCEVKVTEEDGCYYISGNNCQGGELTAREGLSIPDHHELLPEKEKPKGTLFGRIFGKRAKIGSKL